MADNSVGGHPTNRLIYLHGGQIAEYLQALMSLSRSPQTRRFSSSERIPAGHAGGVRAMGNGTVIAESRKAVAALARLGRVCRPALASEGLGGVAARQWLAFARPRLR